MITAIFDTIADVISAMTNVLVDLFEAFTGIFWDGTNLTLVGTLVLISAGVGLTYLGLNFVRGLFKVRP